MNFRRPGRGFRAVSQKGFDIYESFPLHRTVIPEFIAPEFRRVPSGLSHAIVDDRRERCHDHGAIAAAPSTDPRKVRAGPALWRESAACACRDGLTASRFSPEEIPSGSGGGPRRNFRGCTRAAGATEIPAEKPGFFSGIFSDKIPAGFRYRFAEFRESFFRAFRRNDGAAVSGLTEEFPLPAAPSRRDPESPGGAYTFFEGLCVARVFSLSLYRKSNESLTC